MHGNYIQRDIVCSCSIPGNVFAKMLNDRVRCLTENCLLEEQVGFRSGRGCIEQIFVIRQLMEKYLETEEMFAAFIDMERHMTKCGGTHVGTFERIWSEGQVILGSIKTLYKESKACVRVVEDLTGRKGSGRTRSKTGVSLIPMVA